jgi:uncharacterized membrane protein
MKSFLQGGWLGHPLHPVMVHIPSSLLPAAFFLDALSFFGVAGQVLFQVSFYSILFGLLFTLLAVPFGLADWWDIKKDKPAWALGVYHMSFNMIAAVLWALNLGLRFQMIGEVQQTPGYLLALSAAGTLVLFISGYLGGRMVFGFGVSVARLSKDKWRQIAEEGGSRMKKDQEAKNG